MKRRELLAASTVLAWPLAARAQQAPKPPRVGILSPAASDQTPIFQALRKGFADLGYVDGKTILLDYRFAKGNNDALPELARELVKIPVVAIVSDGTSATLAAHQASGTIPIVTAVGNDPVALGFASSFKHPGGNVTGLSHRPAELMGKRLEMLKQAFPGLTRVAVLANPKSGNTEAALRIIRPAADKLRIQLIIVEAGDPDALRALTPASFAGTDGLITVPDAMLWNQRRVVVALAAAAHLPAIYPEREFTDDGGMIAFGPNVSDHFRRATGYVVLILKGAKPGDLPIEESEKFDFVVNLRTARELGLQPAPNFLSGANEVIE